MLRTKALAVIRGAWRSSDRHHRPGLDFLVMALTGKRALNQGMFDKVIRMCDDLVAELKQEQQDDNDKKEYCEQQFDLADDKKKSLERAEKDAENAIAKAKEAIELLTDEIEALEKGIKDLDKSVVEATEQRQEGNQDFKKLMAQDTKAKDILGFAKKRLNKFYNPTLAFAEVSSHDQSKAPPGPPPDTRDEIRMELTDVGVDEWTYLDNFFKRYNKVKLDHLAIERERDRLGHENAQLRSILKQFLDGVSVNQDVLSQANPLLVVNGRVNLNHVPHKRIGENKVRIEAAHAVTTQGIRY